MLACGYVPINTWEFLRKRTGACEKFKLHVHVYFDRSVLEPWVEVEVKVKVVKAIELKA